MIGTRVESLNFGWMEVVSEPYAGGIKRKDDRMIDVKFDNTGFIRRRVRVLQFFQGTVRDGSVNISVVPSMTFKSNNYGTVEVVEYFGSKDITLKFLDTGNVQRGFQLDCVLGGMVVDKKLQTERMEQEAVRREESRTKRIEKERQQAEELERQLKRREEWLIERRKALEEQQERSIRYREERAKRDEEYLINLQEALIPANVNTNLLKTTKGVLNFDFKDRDGQWVLRFSMDGQFIQTRLGKLHNNMTQRVKGCYHAAYDNVGISEDFKDPQKFANWAVNQVGWDLGYSLDKDLLGGRRIYSAETCCFLPQIINAAIIQPNQGKRTFVRKAKSGWTVSLTLGHKAIVVRGFESEEEALEAYKEYRRGYVQRLAKEYRTGISESAYQALMVWEVKIP